MHSALPSVKYFAQKKFAFFFIATALFIAVVFFALRYQSSVETTVGETEHITLAAKNPDFSKDTDEDGLADWEERLVGTNPTNSDTDGDGVSDRKEVFAERDPTTKETASQLAGESGGEHNLTEEVAQSLFVDYLASKKSSSGPNPDALALSLAEQSVSSSLSELPTYSSAQIKTVPDGGEAGIRQYGNNLGAILQKHAFKTKHEALILRDAITTGDKSELEKLYPVAAAYGAVVYDLEKLTPPASVATLHAEFLTGFARMRYTIQTFTRTFEDPMATLISVRQYQENAELLYNAFSESELLFTKHGITFSGNEPGYFVTHAIDAALELVQKQ
ncbi:MAG: hypothetical protein HY455_00485 [Parcubacteria group bacterium]|nr:hypothetical protein [Parcubacteria group bacterium]